MDVRVCEPVSYQDAWYRIEFNGKVVFEVHDADDSHYGNLHENFADCWEIPDMLRAAYDAGVAGEPLTVVKVDTDAVTHEEAAKEDEECLAPDCSVCAKEREQQEETLTKEKAK